MGYGGYHPYPRRFGGNKYDGKPLVEVLHESLNAQRGAAFDNDSATSISSAETEAWARALAYDGWETNERMSLQWDPRRVTDMLPRWEQIFKIRPLPGSSEVSRRAELSRRWARFGFTSHHAYMETELQSRLGDFFVGIEYTSPSVATVISPDASYPWGVQVDGVPWSSTVGHILVRLQKPAGASEAAFYEAAGKVFPTLDPILNAFVTFDWYRTPLVPISVVGGPSAAGFYLDEDPNLDNSVFDV
jgi:hypothetical protein